MKISIFLELALPRPWNEDSEYNLFQENLEIVEAADRAGFSTAWITEHHFMEEYSHASAPELFLAAASQRTKDIRLGHGIMHMPPAVNHPARVAERISTLDQPPGVASSSAPASRRPSPSWAGSSSTRAPSAANGRRP